MMDNKELWKRVFTTDPKAVKPITGKQYSGNSPKPYWIVERLTDEFGPCGIGWGFTILSERFERFGEGDSAEALHIAVVQFWYVLGDKRGQMEQVGQTRASYTTSKGKFLVDEDAPKKSVTDALVKCASYLGFAGDIFSGLWDDSKYVEWAGQEWARREEPEATPREKELQQLADFMVESFENGKELDTFRVWYDPKSWSDDNPTKSEEQKYVWRLLNPYSKVRTAVKANHPDRLKAKEEAAA